MKLHQVLTGAVNPGENTFSVGLLDGAAFTAYASGCDIVILGSNFERVQIIPGSKHGNIQVGCLSCSARLGKIAASYGDTVSIFEPFPLINKASNPLGLQWHKTGQLKVPSAVLDLAWDPQADSLLTASSSLQLWSCSPGSEVAVDSPTSESALTGCVWAAVWTCRTALPVTQIKFSPDGYFFATTGKNDCLVKVWYRTDGWHACRVVGVSGGGSCTDPVVMPTERPAFSFAYLAHPRAVTSLSWRKTSTYLPRGAACNTLLTSCRDGICRVWLETVLPEDCLQECPAVSGHGARGEPPPSVRLAAAAGPRGKAQRERMHHVLGSFQQLKMLKRRKRTLQRDGLGSVLAEALPGSPALPRQPRILAHFHIAASINPKTDIPLMPAMGCPGVDGDGPPFVVHWLNNKYLQFTLSLECLLQQLQPPAPSGGSRGGSGRAADAGSRGSRGSQEEASGEVGGRDAPDGNSDNHSSSRESEDGICSLDDGSEKESDTPTGTAPRRPPGISTTTNTTLTATAAVAASTPADGSGPPGGTGKPKHAGAAGAAWQVENGLDWLVRDWQSAPDMLYSVHALDGSFLVWHVDWLDESQPGVFKQVQVCFSSRIPVAFPAGDAHSMGKHMYLYACPSGARHAGDPTAGTSPHHPRYYSSSSSFSSVPRSSSGHLISSSLGRNLGSCGSIGSIGGGMGGPFGALLVPPSVKLVTKHADGSLNQWAVCFGEDAAFRTVLGISHQSRYCGHRFRLTGQACHAVLPLLLTTAHHAPRDDAPPDGRSSPRPSPTDDVARKQPSGRFVRREAGGSSGRSPGGSPGDAFAGPAMTRRSRRGEGGGGTCGPPGRQLRRLMSDCDVLAVRSELILWRVDPVGPLSHTGGVLELARINCASEDAFAHMAWLPTTVPGYCLGTYCNSPSSCFVASDGWNLRLYQAVIDARKLLDELSKPQLSRLVGDVFSIVSQQSTARPGCIIELDVITEQCPSSTQFLHVFSEELILGRRSKDTEEGDGSNPASGAGPGRAPQFSERFFLVSIERAEGGQSLLKMWSLHLTSVQALAGTQSVDACGLRFLLAVRLHSFLLSSLPPLHRAQLQHQGLSTCHFAWAFHSTSQEDLLGLLPTMQRADGPTWAELRAMGVGWWLRGRAALRLCMEKLAKVAFQRNNDPLDAALYYLAMGKKGVLWGLFRSKGDSKMTQFFSNNFTEERWRSAALKNAFALLGKRRFEQAAAFFLLAGALRDAIEVCLEKLNDIQLALVVARLQEANTDAPATYQSILGCRVLGRNEVSGADAAATPELAELTRACELRKDRDPFLRSIACWVKSDYSGALDALLEQPDSACDADEDGGSGGSGGGSASPGLCSPGVFNFYNFLRGHPLIVRHHMLSHGGAGQRPADTISLRERRLFFATASTHLKSGCPLLALDVLRRMPHAEKEVVTVASARGGGRLPLENGHVHGGGSAWGTAGAHPSSGHHTAESADWASSAMTVADEPLELSWDSEEDEEEEEDEEDDDDEDQGITMKKTRAFKKGTADVVESDAEKRPESLPPAPPGTDGYVDVMAEQMKFRACLKLLVDELRTLATGYEVDRGKLHVQLCHWLEREVATLQEVCGYPGDLHGTAAGSLDTVAEDAGSKLSGATDACPFIGGGGSGGVTPDDTEAWREQHSLRARQLHAARRRQWLCANLPLLHMFLGYCSLHGAQGGGLASVRVELLFLIQESQQEAVLKQLHSRLPLPTVLPLISASLATLKTVISNPVLHVANLAHDILRTVSDMPAPPEPPKDNPQVHMIYVLAASLSACVYQSLCDSHSFSSEAASCPFTGLSYKSCLLRERLRQRHESTSNLQSTSLPSQWPGVTQLLSQLHACRDEEQPPLRMLLCEALLAVFLGMLARALATNAAGRLYRLSARPLDARSWASLFGGAARVPQCATPSPAQTLAPPQQQAPSSSSSKGNSTAEAVKTQQGSTRNRAQQQSETSSSGGRVRADEASKHRHRLNMRILVTSPSPPSTAAPTQRAVVSTVSGSSGGGGGAGGSVELGGSWAQSPLTPCANFREVFVPPELSIWDYYMAKPFVASDDGLGYDSDESEESEEEEEEEDEGDEEADYDPILDKDDERASRRRSREREHSDPNSYSWCLMRLVVVRLAITNMRGFFPMAGLEMSDLPSCSPLCHMALCTLSQWEQALCARLEATPGPPDDYIPTLGAHTGDGPAGPAILRYKAMLEPGNTPFSSHRRSALAAKRLWQFLVRHESMQETFIRHIFTRAHHRHQQQQQQEEESSSSGNLNYVTEDHGSNRTELSAGSPITRARIVHKETDIITAFAINRANPSCLAAASAHEVLELDLSSILSSSCQAWVEEESESEGSSNEDFLVVYTKDDAFRSPSIGSFHTSSPYTPSSTGTTSSVGGQTGRGPTMLLRRNLSNVRRMASHPILPYYVTGGQDGSVRVFEWGHAEQLQVMRPAPAPRVTRLRFCAQSNRKFGVTDGDGFLSLWQLDLTNKNPKPYLTLKCHSRDTFDFTFLGSSSVVATAGQSSDGRNVRLWDTLVPHRSSLVHGFQCLEAGATVLGYAPRSQTLIVGGRKGHVTLLDLRQRVARHTVQAHESAVKAIAVHPGEGFFLTGSAEGNIKVWSLPAPTLISTYANEHARQSIFRHLGAGVMQIETGPGRHVFSCGADGTIKTRVLLQHSGGW
ncbi:LOW QUALITY PROTEIN: dmX-like protein 2 [Lethenteron reissneri]|uniref:LOW QUALITY PROTEIN: dmX-like protein 2 n=1 Tax=Lethenteron reissneri TaxID=7753 RepID=UPI002AB7D83B|nr:LOW QUALITY PROTEIN: dmX-like protein 2 [Lethenteron reissneri]